MVHSGEVHEIHRRGYRQTEMAHRVGRHVEIVRRIVRREPMPTSRTKSRSRRTWWTLGSPLGRLWTGTIIRAFLGSGDTMIDNLPTLARCAALVLGFAPGPALTLGPRRSSRRPRPRSSCLYLAWNSRNSSLRSRTGRPGRQYKGGPQPASATTATHARTPPVVASETRGRIRLTLRWRLLLI